MAVVNVRNDQQISYNVHWAKQLHSAGWYKIWCQPAFIFPCVNVGYIPYLIPVHLDTKAMSGILMFLRPGLAISAVLLFALMNEINGKYIQYKYLPIIRALVQGCRESV